MRYKAILVDLDNTLYPYESAHAPAQAALEAAVCEETGRTPEQVADAYAAARATVKRTIPGRAAEHSRLLYAQLMLEALGATPWAAERLEEVYWARFLDAMEPERALLDVLAGAGRPVCVVSDLTAAIQMRKVLRMGAGEVLPHLVTSEEAGCEKPHPFLFHLAAAKLGVAIEDTVMLGDDWRKDILGAAGAGAHPAWWNPAGAPLPAGALPGGKVPLMCRSAEDFEGVLAL